MERKNKEKGFVTLLMVIVTVSIAMTVATSLVLLGLGYSRNSLAINQSDQAKALADACAERGLEAIRDNPAASGTTNIAFGPGRCSFTIIIQAGESRIVQSEAYVGTIVRKVQVTVSALRPKIITSSWQEVI